MEKSDFLRKNLDFSVNLVYKPLGEKGEDDFFQNYERPDLHTHAVFDGCGGAGSWQYPEYHGATGAFIASHVLAKEYEAWFEKLSADSCDDLDKLADDYHNASLMTLKKLKDSCSPMGVSGTLVKSFPSTISAAIMREKEGQLELTALNCGDSRVYYLTPENGLVQLTVDDLRGHPDPMENLWASGAQLYVLNADYPYVITARQVNLSLPCAVMSASDGVFGFVRSPMDFEYLLLNCLMTAKFPIDFENRFREEIISITGDDSTATISFYGFGSWENIKKEFEKRWRRMKEVCEYMDNAEDEEDEIERIRRIWALYKKETVTEEDSL